MDDLKQLTAGSFAGACGKFVAYPFDTIKVRMQMGGSTVSATACIKNIVKTEGPSGFFRGLAAPIAGAAFENATVFWGYALSFRLFCAVTGADRHSDRPSLTSIAFSGYLAGTAAAFVNTPVEMLKGKMQIEHTRPTAERQYSGVFDVARKMLRAGGVRSLYRGFAATALREGPGTAAWFWTYHKIMRMMLAEGQPRGELPAHKLLFAGGCGGVAFWALIFPVDVVKTRVQLQPQYAKMGFLRAFQSIYKFSGYRGLYGGLGITMVRAVPANGVVFAVYEKAAAHWDVLFADSAL